MKPKVFAMSAQNGEAEILCYDEIGFNLWTGEGIASKQFAQDLKSLGDIHTINLLMNSPGGDVFEGLAIYNTLMNSKAQVNVRIDGLAASIASVIAMAGDKITIAENGSMMIHAAWTLAIGNAADLRKTADTLDTITQGIVASYAKRTGMDAKKITTMMDAETWMTGQECVDQGFADAVMPCKQGVSAKFAMNAKYRNAPKELLASKEDPAADLLASYPEVEHMRLRLDLMEHAF